MPGPVVNGVRKEGLPALDQATSPNETLPFLPLLNEGTIKLILLSSGGVLMARLMVSILCPRRRARPRWRTGLSANSPSECDPS